MKSLLAISAVLLCSFMNHNKYDGNTVVDQMFAKYHGKWIKSLSLSQTTEVYKNDRVVDTATWHKTIVYPNNFRIDYGEKNEGDAAIFAGDSVYVFQKGELNNTSANDNLIFILGGMYFYSLDSVKSKFNALNYDLTKSYQTLLDNKPVYVIGAANADEKTNQFWVDAEHLYVVKFITYIRGQKEEGVLKDQKQFGNAWAETACDIYIDNKLVQSEKYFNVKVNPKIDPDVFDYKNFSEME